MDTEARSKSQVSQLVLLRVFAQEPSNNNNYNDIDNDNDNKDSNNDSDNTAEVQYSIVMVVLLVWGSFFHVSHRSTLELHELVHRLSAATVFILFIITVVVPTRFSFYTFSLTETIEPSECSAL